MRAKQCKYIFLPQYISFGRGTGNSSFAEYLF